MKKNQSGFTAVELVIILVVVGVLGFVGYTVWQKRGKTATPAATSATTPAASNTATNTGTCFGVSKATIKSILGAPAATLQDLSDTKTQDIGKGDTARTCVYTFVAGATVNNSFTMDLGTYATQANMDASQKYLPTGGESVSGLGDSATYLVTNGSSAQPKDFVLSVHQDLKIYKFAITQPNDTVTYTNATAKAALTQIAQAATL